MSVHPLKMYQHTIFHGATLTGASFPSISEVLTPAVLEWLMLRDSKYGVEAIFNGVTCLMNFMKF